MNLTKFLCFFVVAIIYHNKSIAQDEGYKEEQLTHNTFDNRYASYNSEGQHIVFESNRDGHWQIYIMDVNGNDQRRVFTSTANDRRPTWHPYKNIILFESDRSGKNDIYTYNIATRAMAKVPIPLKGNKIFAQFAPNGKEIVFNYKVSDKNYNIYIVSIKGKRLKTIVDNQYRNVYPRYSPRGDAIVYFSRKHTKNKDDEIYANNIITKKEARLTQWPQHDFCPTWSNNEQLIVFARSMEDSKAEIYIMNKDGKTKRRITFNDAVDTLPTWSPKDINLLITGFRDGSYQICKIILKEPLGTSPKFSIQE